VELGEVRVTLPAAPPPPEIIDMTQRTDLRMGPVTLMGYDQHKLGFVHAPQTLLLPGDTVEFVFYWQAPDPLPADWPPAQTFTLTLGEQQLISPLAGPSLPTAGWSPGQIVRVTVQLPYDGGAQRAVLAVDGAETMLAPLAK
jgi:hypothetical protein